MTEYELKKAIMVSAPALEREEEKELLDSVAGWYVSQGPYLMLLSNEAKYYTIFNSIKQDPNKFISELRVCLDYLGAIKSAEVFNDRVEFWITKGQEANLYILFDYTGGVIEI